MTLSIRSNNLANPSTSPRGNSATSLQGGEFTRVAQSDSRATFKQLREFRSDNSGQFQQMFARSHVASPQDRELATRLAFVAATTGGTTGEIALDRLNNLLTASEQYHREPNKTNLTQLENARANGWQFQQGYFGASQLNVPGTSGV